MDAQAAIKTYIDDHYEEAVALLETLGKIPAPSYQEDRRAEFCRDWFLKQGAKDVSIDQAQNVICAIDADRNRELVVFMAHTDIVFPDTEELPMKREKNLLFAPGIGDDTANLVNLMMSAKYFIQNESSFNRGILVIANSCEEGLGNLAGCREIFKTYGSRVKEFYSFDGYLSQCTSIPVGSCRYRIVVKGEGGHSYEDFGRENAIHSASKLISELYDINPPTEEKTTYNVGTITGGTTVNSIPQEVSLLYEYRSSSHACLDIMKAQLDRVIASHRAQGAKIEAALLGIRPGMGNIDRQGLSDWTERNTAVIRSFYDGEVHVHPASTDANIPLSLGIKANTIGTILGGDAHRREEWVDLESIPAGMSIIMHLINQYQLTAALH